jgi:hypothetical protein
MNSDLLAGLRELRRYALLEWNGDEDDLEKRIVDLGSSVDNEDMPGFMEVTLGLCDWTQEDFVPQELLYTVKVILEGHSAKISCDPWAS